MQDLSGSRCASTAFRGLVTQSKMCPPARPAHGPVIVVGTVDSLVSKAPPGRTAAPRVRPAPAHLIDQVAAEARRWLQNLG